MKQPVFKPLGLVTQPDEYDQYPPGALSKALNVCMRDPGKLSSLPDTQVYRADVMSNGYTVRALFPMAASVLAFGDSGGTFQPRWVTSGASTAITTPASYGTLAFDTGKARAATIRDRTTITPNLGPIVFDAEASTTPRISGFYMPGNVSCATVYNTNAQSMATGKNRRYRTLFRREQSDGYILVGPVSNAADVDNSSGVTIDPEIQSYFSGNIALIAGDIVEVYRTFDKDSGTDPGDTYQLAKSYRLTNTDIANGFAAVRDTSTDDSLGVELYTNPGQQGLQNTNLPAPVADDVVTFKGYTLYLSRKLPPSLTFKMNNKVGSLTTTTERTYGIGTRAVTGDTTNGNANILNISNTVGVVIGQAITGTGIQADSRITSVVGTTITLNKTATATNVGTALTIKDTLETTGASTYIVINRHSSFFADNADYEVITDTPIQTLVVAGPTVTFGEPQGATYTIRHKRYNNSQTPFAIRATNQQNYSPTLPDVNGGTALTGDPDTRYNRWHFSKDQQPESVPTLSYFFVGAGTNYRGIATRDCVWVFASDGLWRISGGGPTAADWRVDPVNPTLILAARGAVGKLGDTVYAYTERGLVAIDTSGTVTTISRGVIGDAATLPGAAYADTWNTFLTCDELHNEVWLTIYDGASASTTYVYNALTKIFTTVAQGNAYSAMAYSRALQSLVIGRVDTAPDVYYFNADTSNTRMSGSDVRYQPISPQPDVLSEFHNVDFIFGGVTVGALTLVPSFDGTAYTAATVPTGTFESRVRVPVPRNAPAVAPVLRPGFTLSSGGTTNPWHLKGISVESDVVGTEVTR